MRLYEAGRAGRVKEAVDTLHLLGEQPTATKVQRELGDNVTGNLNGRDTLAFREAMEANGYIKDKVHNKWRRPSSD